jgi:acyl dehydratase
MLVVHSPAVGERGMMAFFEDIEIGEERSLGSHTFTRDAIIEFARQYDPQRFHVDEEAAKGSIFGGLCASGWHVAAAAMRCIVDTRTRGLAELAARGEVLPPLGVSPGVENLRWPNPTRPGDVVAYYSLIVSKRETKRPEWGLAFIRTWGVNQHGQEAIVMDNRAFIGRRGG